LTRFLIVTDLDGTLLGDEPALDAFRVWYADRRAQIDLAYSSGRSFESIALSMKEFSLPLPVAVICEVGTEIRCLPSAERLTNWPACPFWSAEVVRGLLATHPQLTLQPEEFQTRLKVSYFFHNASELDIEEIRGPLLQRGIEAEIVYSSDRDLDILPAGVNKGLAARHLAAALDIPIDRMIVCGDSGNDASMMCCGARGVIVANAQRELKQMTGDHLYHARGEFAAGVIEGIEHWLQAQ
jgi:mannosylfructose-6-phosphate phosphatase